MNNITIDAKGDAHIYSYDTVDMINPCYFGTDCYNFHLKKFQLTPRKFANYALQVKSVKPTRNTYWYRKALYLDSYENVAVISGHFNWQVWLHLDTYVQQFMTPVINPIKMTATGAHVLTATSYEYLPPDAIPPPKCMVIGRHPIARFISYYYQRCFTSVTCAGNLSIAHLLISYYDHLFPYHRIS